MLLIVANGVAVAQRWALGTNTSEVVAARAMRINQDLGLAPKGKQGGGRASADWYEDALINYALTVAIADPMNKAPEFVEAYRKLQMVERYADPAEDAGGNRADVPARRWRARNDMTIPVDADPPILLAAPTLGERLDRLLDATADGRLLKRDTVRVELSSNEPRASVSYRMGAYEVTDCYGPASAGMTRAPEREADLQRTVMIPFATFELLAELLRDSRARQRSKHSSGSPPGSSGPESRSGATPGREAPPSKPSTDAGPHATPHIGNGSLDSPENIHGARACAIPTLVDGPPSPPPSTKGLL